MKKLLWVGLVAVSLQGCFDASGGSTDTSAWSSGGLWGTNSWSSGSSWSW